MNRLFGARARLALLFTLPALGAAAVEDERAPPPSDAPAAAREGEAVVIGQRPRTATADPTAAGTVIDARQFAGEAKTIAELVATAPGVAVNGYGGLGQLTTVSIRGSTADQVQVLLDGLALNGAAGGGVDLSRIPRSWIQRIEVVRGAEGAVFGPGAVGGALNIVTKSAVAGSWSAQASAASYGTYQGAADAAVGGSRWRLLAAAQFDDTTGRFPYLFDRLQAIGTDPLERRMRDHNASRAAAGLAKLGATLGEGRLDAALHLSGGSRDLPGSPYQLTPGDGQRDLRAAVVARYAQPLADGLHLAVDATGRDDHLTVRIVPFPEARQRDFAGEASARVAWSAGPSTLTVGAVGGAEQLDVERAPGHARGRFAVSVADDLAFAGGRAHVASAARWDREGPHEGASAKLGATVLVTGPLSARANVAHAFRAPSFGELYLAQGLLAANPDLVPERSWSADAAVVASGARGFASVGAFAQLYRELIVYEPDSFRRLKPFSDGKAVARGVEVDVASAPLGPLGLAASAAYTLLATETLRGEEAVLGKALPHRAHHRLFARVAGGRGPVEAHAEAQYVSLQYQDLRNLIPIPAALSFNLGGALRLWRRPEARLHLEIRNLLDDRSLQDGFGNPLPGRMVLVTLRVAGGKESAP